MSHSPVRAMSSFVVARDGSLVSSFPVGEHVFPADLSALHALASAIRADFAETHWIPFADATEHAPGRPLRLQALRGFIAQRWPAFEAAVDQPRVAQAGVAYWQLRLDRLRALGAPEIIVADAEAELAVVARGELTAVDLAAITHDVVGAASIVDVRSRQASGEPLTVDIDIATLLLLAVFCCMAPDAMSIDVSGTSALAWASMIPDDREEPLSPDAIRVRASVSADSLARLEMADVRGGALGALATTGVVGLLIETEGEDGEEDEYEAEA